MSLFWTSARGRHTFVNKRHLTKIPFLPLLQLSYTAVTVINIVINLHKFCKQGLLSTCSSFYVRIEYFLEKNSQVAIFWIKFISVVLTMLEFVCVTFRRNHFYNFETSILCFLRFHKIYRFPILKRNSEYYRKYRTFCAKRLFVLNENLFRITDTCQRK